MSDNDYIAVPRELWEKMKVGYGWLRDQYEERIYQGLSPQDVRDLFACEPVGAKHLPAPAATEVRQGPWAGGYDDFVRLPEPLI
jgi:hypothetical protein